jgi:hypothetical protein
MLARLWLACRSSQRPIDWLASTDLYIQELPRVICTANGSQGSVCLALPHSGLLGMCKVCMLGTAI